jgi:hypothetical protein
MPSIFAPPQILSAWSCAVAGERGDQEGDTQLRPGTHLRLFAGIGPSFPITPFSVYRLTAESSHLRTYRSELGVEGETAALIRHDEDELRTVRIDIDPGGGSVAGATLLDQRGRVVATRDAPPFAFSAPLLHRIALRGGPFSGGSRFVTQSMVARGAVNHVGVLGLPLVGQFPWYLGIQTRAEGLRRVEGGAPWGLNPMDRPDGPFDDIDPKAEVARVEAMLAEKLPGGTLEGVLERLLSDKETPPWKQLEDPEPLELAGKQKQQTALARRLGLLQLAALDPGVARFLGFAARLEMLPLPTEQWDTLAIAGLFAVSAPELELMGAPLAGLLDTPANGGPDLLNMHIRALSLTADRDMTDEVKALSDDVRQRGYGVLPFVAVTSPTPPWRAPSLPLPQIVQRRWLAAKEPLPGHRPEPSRLYRASFAFPRMPLVTLAALGRNGAGGWEGCHDPLKLAPPWGTRACSAAFGREIEPTARYNEMQTSGSLDDRAGLLSCGEIPGDAPMTFRAHAADIFGRFGSPTDFMVSPPPRPRPPPPVLRGNLAKVDPDPESKDSLSPGTFELLVAVPNHIEPHFADEARLHAAVLLPRLADLPAGGLALEALNLELFEAEAFERDAALAVPLRTRDVPLNAPGLVDVPIPLPALKPQAMGVWILRGRFRDSAGTLSVEATLRIEARDRRPPPVVKTAIGIFWTAAPGSAPDVELRLRWPAADGARYRVYLADEAAIPLPPALGAKRGKVHLGRELHGRLGELDWVRVGAIYAEMVAEARHLLAADGADPDGIVCTPSARMCYDGHSVGISVPIPSLAPGKADIAEIERNFLAAYLERFDPPLNGQTIKALTWLLDASVASATEPPRALVAALACQAVRDGTAGNRDAFRLLTEPPIVAQGSFATLSTTLPRSLETVQFLRVVPLGVDGAEPPFDKCGLFPVAVPGSRRPPPPRLSGTVDPATGIAELTVTTDGLDAALLRAEEAGLFPTGGLGAAPPLARIRRAAGARPDPIYATPVGGVQPLALVDERGPEAVFSVKIEDKGGDTGLAPFVRYAYWAEVAMPPERRVPAGFKMDRPDGGPEAVHAPDDRDHPRPMSAPSAPLVLMRVPPDLPPAPAQADVAVARRATQDGGAELSITIADPPRAARGAMDRYRLAVWTQWPRAAIEPVRRANDEDLAGNWPVAENGAVVVAVAPPPPGVLPADAITLRLAYLDPAGRLGPLLETVVP